MLLIADSDGLVLTIVEVFLPVFIGLEQPEEDNKEDRGEENKNDIYHDFVITIS